MSTRSVSAILGALGAGALLAAVGATPAAPAGHPPQLTPAEHQPEQRIPFGIRRIGATQSPTARIDGLDERVDVDVAVIDSGVAKHHPDLNVVGGVNLSGQGGSRDWGDRDGHGTLTAGVIGALDNGIGVVGVAPGARIWAVRTGLEGEQTLRALGWVTRHADTIEVVTLGGGFERSDPTATENRRMRSSVRRLVAAGVTLVTPAGNESVDERGGIPGSYPESLNVSAFADFDGRPGGLGPRRYGHADDHFASFSNFGRGIDLSAPGADIRSTLPGGNYGRADGTSFSAPHVAGVAALHRATHPAATPAATRGALLAGRERRHLPGDPDRFDEGIVNARGL